MRILPNHAGDDRCWPNPAIKVTALVSKTAHRAWSMHEESSAYGLNACGDNFSAGDRCFSTETKSQTRMPATCFPFLSIFNGR